VSECKTGVVWLSWLDQLLKTFVGAEDVVSHRGVDVAEVDDPEVSLQQVRGRWLLVVEATNGSVARDEELREYAMVGAPWSSGYFAESA